MKYYVYTHIRLDNNTPFYVGIGTINQANGFRSQYKRAFTSSRRNFMWKNIVNLTNYKVDIVFESSSLLEVKSEEIRLIKFYGRKDLKEGLLINNTNGGDGRMAPNKESMINVGKNLLQYTTAKRKVVYQYDINGNLINTWESLFSVVKHFKLSSSSGILQCLQKKIRLYKNYIWRYIEGDDTVLREKKHCTKKIGKYDKKTSLLIDIYTSLKSASEENAVSFKAISLCALGKTKSSGGFIWKYI